MSPLVMVQFCGKPGGFYLNTGRKKRTGVRDEDEEANEAMQEAIRKEEKKG